MNEDLLDFSPRNRVSSEDSFNFLINEEREMNSYRNISTEV